MGYRSSDSSHFYQDVWYSSLDIDVFDEVYGMILPVGYNIYLINARERVCLTNPTGSVTVALSQELPFQY